MGGILSLGYDIILSDYKGQPCVAGSHIFVHEGIYDEFLKKFTAIADKHDLTLKISDSFGQGTEHGPQVLNVQFDVSPHILAVMYGKEVNKQNPQVIATTDCKDQPHFSS